MKHLDEYFAKLQKDIENRVDYKKDKDEISDEIPQESIYEDIKDGKLKIKHLSLTFTEESFFDNRLLMMFPKNFFHSELKHDENNWFYRNLESDTNFILTYVKGVTEINIKKIKKGVEDGFTASKLATKWISEGEVLVAGKAVKYVSFINPAPKESVFNFMIFPIVRDGHIVININGGENTFDIWESVGTALIKTMQFL